MKDKFGKKLELGNVILFTRSSQGYGYLTIRKYVGKTKYFLVLEGVGEAKHTEKLQKGSDFIIMGKNEEDFRLRHRNL